MFGMGKLDVCWVILQLSCFEVVILPELILMFWQNGGARVAASFRLLSGKQPKKQGKTSHGIQQPDPFSDLRFVSSVSARLCRRFYWSKVTTKTYQNCLEGEELGLYPYPPMGSEFQCYDFWVSQLVVIHFAYVSAFVASLAVVVPSASSSRVRTPRIPSSWCCWCPQLLLHTMAGWW